MPPPTGGAPAAPFAHARATIATSPHHWRAAVPAFVLNFGGKTPLTVSSLKPHIQRVQLQPRDIAVLRALFEARVMTLEHLSALCFNGHSEAAKKRVQKLKGAGFVAERPRRVYDRSVLFLTKKGFEVLSQGDHLFGLPQMEWTRLEKRVRVSPLTLAHELEVMDGNVGIVA